MKTIQELNSKWYWRLIKVVGIILCLSIVLSLTVGAYFFLEEKYQITQQDPMQRYLDDPRKSTEGKQALMDNLKSGVPKDILRAYIIEHHYPQIIGEEKILYILPRITIAFIGIFLGAIIILYVLRGTIYYIILGKFNPEK